MSVSVTHWLLVLLECRHWHSVSVKDIGLERLVSRSLFKEIDSETQRAGVSVGVKETQLSGHM